MDCAVASAFGLSAGDCCFVLRLAKPEDYRYRRSDRRYWFVDSGLRGGLSQKTGSADNDGPVCVHAESAVSWQRSSRGWSGIGNALLDFWMRSRSLLRGRLLHRDAKRRRRVAWALR